VGRLEESAGRPGHGVRFVGEPDHRLVAYGELHDDARAVAAALQRRGVVPGDRVAILGPTSRQLVTAIQACWLAGAASMVLPLPMRMGSVDEFVNATRLRITHGQARLLLIDDSLAPFYAAAPGDPPTESLASVMPGQAGVTAADLDAPDADPERLVILQYTSGSTSEPKGVMIPDRVLGANLDAILAVTGLTVGEDVGVSWLPLYHDMGLVGLLALPMTSGVDLVLAAPTDFLGHPGSWMQWISDYRGTCTAGPNFSWVLATRALKRMHGLDLSPLRIALNGAEPVDPSTVGAFVTESERHGFRAGGVFPAFGMAEVAIAGTFPPPGRGLVCDPIDRIALETRREAVRSEPGLDTTRLMPMLGRAVPGLEIRICDTGTGEVLTDRQVGELEIRGTSVTPGYFRRPELNDELFHDGWLRTGDLGYLLDGELVLCGRIKDVIIIGGRNVYPQDIERAVDGVDGVRPGNVVAFGVEGYKAKESVVVVAETKLTEPDAIEALRKAIHHVALDVAGVPPRDVILVRPSTMPKTSSGKLQRALTRQYYVEERLDLA
jgi:fatty-acyl-CoA synthase